MCSEHSEFRVGAIVPTYRHVTALPAILATLSQMQIPVIVVDDGNSEENRRAIESACSAVPGVRYVRRAENGGKGQAVKTGLLAAGEQDWSHAIQIDADGQHDLAEIQPMIALARAAPGKVICAVPVYDDTIPKSRRIGREITHFWVRIETMGGEISDSMCGFRIYPLDETLHVVRREFIGARMDFDTELLVQLNWRGLRVVEHPVRVTYPEGNVSNFRMLSDNVRISAMHTRLVLQAPVRVPIRSARRALLGRYEA